MGSTMVLYRAEEHRKLELDRSIIQEQEGTVGNDRLICLVFESLKRGLCRGKRG